MNSLIAIQSYPSRVEAEIAKGLLTSNGIESVVFADDAGGLYPPFTTMVQLKVDEQDVRKAKKILQK